MSQPLLKIESTTRYLTILKVYNRLLERGWFLDKKVEGLYYSLSEKKSKIYIERSVVSNVKFKLGNTLYKISRIILAF